MDQEWNQKFGEKRLHLLSWRFPYFAPAISLKQIWTAIPNPRHQPRHRKVQIFEAGYVTIYKYL
jgi:hypothetical protein